MLHQETLLRRYVSRESVGIVIIAATFLLTAGSHFSYTPDDSYIYFQYAKNVARGAGVSFNAGEPSYGMTSPLWMFLIAGLGRIGFDIYSAAKTADLLFAAGGLIVFYFLAREILSDQFSSLCVTAAFSLNPWLLRWAGSGMETSLCVFLLLCTFLMLVRSNYHSAAVLSGLMTLVRPESGLLMVIILSSLWFLRRGRHGGHLIRQSVSLSLLYAVVAVPWFLYAWRTFGSPIPNTLRAKSAVVFNPWDSGATFIDLVRTIGFSDGVAVAVVAICGLFLLMQRGRKTDAGNVENEVGPLTKSLPGVAWALLLSAVYCFRGVNIVSRYLLLFSPLIIIGAYVFTTESVRRSLYHRRTTAVIAALTLLIGAQSLAAYYTITRPGVVAFESGMQATLVPIGKWLHENTPPNSLVVTADIGAIGYYSDRRVFDAAGLVTPAMLQLFREGYAPYTIIEEERYAPFCAPDYIIDRGYQPHVMEGRPHMSLLFTTSFARMSLLETRPIYYSVYKVLNR